RACPSGKGWGVGNGSWGRGAPARPRPAVIANLQALEVGVGIQRLTRAVPVEESKIQRWADHVRAQLPFDLLSEELPRPAVNGAMHQFDRAAVKDRQLKEIGIGYDAGQGPASRHRHLDLPLQERLADLKVRKELSALVELRPDLPACGGLNPCEIVPDGGIACMRWHRFQRAAHEQWFLGG